MIGKPILVVQDGDGHMTTTADELGLPKGLFPRQMRLRNEAGEPRWFTRERFEGAAAIYKSGDETLRVEGE